MPYLPRLKIFTNENLPEGKVSIPKDAVNDGHVPLIHCHPNDFLQIMKIIAEYYKGIRNGNQENNINKPSATQHHDKSSYESGDFCPACGRTVTCDGETCNQE